MNYELAKKLKDAGFPQNGYWFWSSDETDTPSITTEANVYDTCNVVKTADGRSYEKMKLCSAPTLSELIEACGDNFNRLVKESSGWSAIGGGDDWNYNEEGIGETPEIAIANLWLVLKSK